MLFGYAMLSGDEPSLIEELWQYIYQTYFTESEAVYENLNFGTGSMMTLRNIIFGLLIGFIIASFAVIIDKRVLGNFVRRLLDGENIGPENAVTLSDAGYNKKQKICIISNAVRRSVNIRRVVRCLEEEKFNTSLDEAEREYEKKRAENPELPAFKRTAFTPNAAKDHFYIPEEMKYTADIKFDKKGTSWWMFFVLVIIAIVLFAVLLFAIPQLLQMLDNFIGSISA